MRRYTHYLIVAIVFVAGALGLATHVALAQPPAAKTVAIRNLAFEPKVVTVNAGQAVVWKNEETLPISHTTTSGTCAGTVCTAQPGWDSGFLNPGMSFTQTFTTVGTFPYFCKVHGAAMTGTVQVISGTVTPTATATLSATATRTATPSPTLTNTPTPAATSTPTSSPTASLTASPTASPSATRTATPALTLTPTPTVTPAPAATGGGGDLTLWIIGLLAVIAIAGIGWWLYTRRR